MTLDVLSTPYDEKVEICGIIRVEIKKRSDWSSIAPGHHGMKSVNRPTERLVPVRRDNQYSRHRRTQATPKADTASSTLCVERDLYRVKR